MLRRVDSTQSFAAADNFFTARLAGVALSSATFFFAEVLRIWLRA